MIDRYLYIDVLYNNIIHIRLIRRADHVIQKEYKIIAGTLYNTRSIM